MPCLWWRLLALACEVTGLFMLYGVVASPSIALASNGAMHALWCSGAPFCCLGKQKGFVHALSCGGAFFPCLAK